MIRRLALPTVVLLAFAFLFAPVIVVVLSAFNAGAVLAFPPRSFTTRWFGMIQPSFFDALYVSLIVASIATTLATLVGVPGALALVRGRFPGRQAINALCISPLTVPALVTGVALFQFSVVVWDVSGLTLGGTVAGLVLGHLTFAIPFVVRAVVAAHARFDSALEEAAQNLGATPLQTFFKITLPILKPGIVSGAIFAFLMSLDDVPISLFMGGGWATTLPVKIFTSLEFDFGGDIMAIAALIVGVSVGAMIVLDRIVSLDQLFGARQ